MGRRGVWLVAVVVLIAGCISTTTLSPALTTTPPPAVTASAPSGPSPIPWTDAAYVTATPEPTPAPDQLSLCPADGVVLLAGGWSGATGSAAGGAVFLNVSANPCQLPSPTSEVLRDATGAVVAERSGGSVEPAVGVPPGGDAWATVVWANWCRPRPPALPMRLSLTLGLATDSGAATSTTLVADVSSLSVEPSLTPRCDDPGAPSTVGLVQLQAGKAALGDYSRQPCDRSALRAYDDGWGAAAGTWYSDVVLYNATSFDCNLPVSPKVEIRGADGRLAVSASGPAGPVLAIPSGGTVTIQLTVADWCTPSPRLPLRADFVLGSERLAVATVRAGEGSDPVGDCMVAPATPPPTFLVGPYVDPTAPQSDTPPPDPGDVLSKYVSVALSLPPSVTPGTTLNYTVTLTNHDPYGKPYNLSADCPSFTERLVVQGQSPTVGRYLLNCGPAGVIDAGDSRTFAMRLTVPPELPVGPATVIWQLGQASAGAKGEIAVVSP